PSPATSCTCGDEEDEPPYPDTRKQHNNFADHPALKIVRRPASASRPVGRSAVGLRPSLDPDADLDASSQDQDDHIRTRNPPQTGIDRPRSFRNDQRICGMSRFRNMSSWVRQILTRI